MPLPANVRRQMLPWDRPLPGQAAAWLAQDWAGPGPLDLGGVLVIEFIFDYPGLGLLTINAVMQRDFPLIQGIAIVTAAASQNRHQGRPNAASM